MLHNSENFGTTKAICLIAREKAVYRKTVFRIRRPV